jgi:transposase-like protein
MSSKNVDLKRVRISTVKYRLLFKCFVVDCTAIQTARIVSLNRNTINRYFTYFRQLIIAQAFKERQLAHLSNGVEIDESYFGPRRVRGKRGRGAARKMVVLGLLKRGGKVFTEVVPDASKQALLPIIRATVKSGSDIYSDGWRSYDALAIYGYNHKKVRHEQNEFSTGDVHINGVESFWSWAKRRINKFNGIPKT